MGKMQQQNLNETFDYLLAGPSPLVFHFKNYIHISLTLVFTIVAINV